MSVVEGGIEGVCYREGEVVPIEFGECRTQGSTPAQLAGIGVCLVLKTANYLYHHKLHQLCVCVCVCVLNECTLHYNYYGVIPHYKV